ncbi:MAG: IS3 family transposase [Candidatus Micrarchaeota archaeon]
MLHENIQNQSSVDTKTACQLAGMHANTYRQRDKTKPRVDQVTRHVKRIAKQFPRYGYRRITKTLQREHFSVNHKRVHKIMQKHGLIAKKRKAFKPATTDSNHGFFVQPNRVKSIRPTRLNQVWVSDITYVQLPKGFAYLAVVLDRFSRKVLGWQLSRDIDTNLTLDALTRAIASRNGQNLNGLIHHSDRGVQYAANAYIQQLDQYGILASMSAKGNPYDNAFAESFMKTVKYDEVYLNEYESFDDAYQNIEHFIEEVYNKKRLHSAIGYQPPAEFEQKILKGVGA